MAEAAGADILSVITPSFAKASQHELIVHYTRVAEAVPNMPIVLYNIPMRTGNALEPQTVVELAKTTQHWLRILPATGITCLMLISSLRMIWNLACSPAMMR